MVEGPYRYVRNPMISSMLLMLTGEALILESWVVFFWMLAFFAINTVYFPLFEEPQLLKRFGQDYRRYRAAVPRWVPNFFQ